ncbi:MULTISPECIES: hypothetical protein [Priestia]|uniref:hypothetical protein n=1 Tax=Priestia TaxID=2800373 RepID=UPI000532C855|nr:MULTISPECIES: hypothetical protein [Priestia]
MDSKRGVLKGNLRSLLVILATQSIISRLESGRQTHEKWEKQFSWYEGIMINRNEFRNKDVMESLKIIRDLNPDASMAIWNFLRLSNNGHELECRKPTGSNDKQGLDYINGLARRRSNRWKQHKIL